MTAQPRSPMPTMTAIADHWRAQNPPWLKSWHIGWGEPFCFACGWLPPVADGRVDSWEIAAKWLDRAHLQDHFFGGSEEPSNLMPLCHLCHDAMPDSPSRDEGLQWVQRRRDQHPAWQLWTDSRLFDVTPTRTTTLLRQRMHYLEAVSA